MPHSLIIFGVVVVLLIGLVLSRRRRLDGEPCCAQCSYPVRGLPTPACPECGADLREVGIRYPQPGFFQNPASGVFTLTVLVLIGHGALNTALGYLLPVRKGSQEHLRFESAGRSVTVLLGTSTWTTEQNLPPYGDRDIFEHTIEVVMPDSGVHRLTTSDPDDSFVDEKPGGSRVYLDRPLDEQALAEWLAPLGLIGTEKPPEGLPAFLAGILRADIDQNVISRYTTGKLHNYSTGSSITIWEQPGWYQWRRLGGFILWAMLWLVLMRREVQSPRHRAYSAIAVFMIIGLVTCNSMVGRVLPDRGKFELTASLSRGSMRLEIRNLVYLWGRDGDEIHNESIVFDERSVELQSPDHATRRLVKRDEIPGFETEQAGASTLHHDKPLDESAIADWLRSFGWRNNEEKLRQDAKAIMGVLDAGLDMHAASEAQGGVGGQGRSFARVGSTWRDVGFVAFWGVLGILLARRAKRTTRRGHAYPDG